MVGIQAIDGFRHSAGIGYIAIPSDIDRALYINACYQSSTVSIKTEDGGFVNRVPIGPNDLMLIEFPEKTEDFGTPVVYVTEQLHQHPIVVAVLNSKDDLSDMSEGQFKIRRKFGKQYVEITGSALKKFLGMTIHSDTDAEVYINVDSDQETGKLKVNVSGNVEVVASKSINIQSHVETTSRVSDPEDENSFSQSTQTKDTFRYETDKFIINNEDQPMVLGNIMKELFDDFIDEVSKIKVMTTIGLQPIVNKVQVTAFKQRTKNILSEKGFIDK